MHVYSMQPMLDTFNKAGTFGYAYALLPLLTCRRSRVGQQKKKSFMNDNLCWTLTCCCHELSGSRFHSRL